MHHNSCLAIVVVGILSVFCPRIATSTVITCAGDVTVEVQEAIANASSSDGHVQFTKGECSIQDTITICNQEGLRIEGAGAEATLLHWTSTTSEGPMFSLQNSAGIAFSELGICVEGSAQDIVTLNSAFDLYNACIACEYNGVQQCDPAQAPGYYPGGLPSSHGNSFTNVSIAACDATNGILNHGVRIKLYGERDLIPEDGVAIGCSPPLDSVGDLTGDGQVNQADYRAYYIQLYAAWTGPDPAANDEWENHLRADCHNEHHSFTNVEVSEFRESAFVIEGNNSLGNTFFNTHCNGRYLDDPDVFHAGCCGKICVETGQNRWSYNQGEGVYEHFHVHEVVSNVPGRSERSNAGHFFWFGGTATDLADAVFVLGFATSPVKISALQAKRSRSLVRALDPRLPRQNLALSIDSVRFDGDGVHAWDGVPVYQLGPNEFGNIVYYPYHGPLMLRDSSFGQCSNGDGNEGVRRPEEMSLRWNYPDEGYVDYRGAFVFEGNAFATSYSNPFFPDGAVVDPDREEYWIYPTTQRANLVCKETVRPSSWHWEPMEQHFTEIDTSECKLHSCSFALSYLPTSSNLVVLQGAPSPIAGKIHNFTQGVVGQEVLLIGGDEGGQTIIEHNAGQIELANDLGWRMGYQDVLLLLLDENGVWKEIARSDNE